MGFLWAMVSGWLIVLALGLALPIEMALAGVTAWGILFGLIHLLSKKMK